MKPDLSEVPEFYRTYFDHLEEETITEALTRSRDAFQELMRSISEVKSVHRYKEGKWSIRDIVQHLIDAERVFMYRALRFSRNDTTELSGFEINKYAEEAEADSRSLASLISEWEVIRSSSIMFFESMTDEKLERRGMASGSSMSVRFLGYVMSGHLFHHLQVINERYL